jgi:hypothetical protein
LSDAQAVEEDSGCINIATGIATYSFASVQVPYTENHPGVQALMIILRSTKVSHKPAMEKTTRVMTCMLFTWFVWINYIIGWKREVLARMMSTVVMPIRKKQGIVLLVYFTRFFLCDRGNDQA